MIFPLSGRVSRRLICSVEGGGSFGPAHPHRSRDVMSTQDIKEDFCVQRDEAAFTMAADRKKFFEIFKLITAEKFILQLNSLLRVIS
jgi:hypothetical protein